MINLEGSKKAAAVLCAGGVGIIPTDTLYGLVGSALNAKTVERVYKLRKRELSKPMIVLISSLEDLKLFEIKISEKILSELGKIWPGKVSVVLECESDKFSYLTRGGSTVAFRLPENSGLLDFLKKTGPLVAPSANLAGDLPTKNISQARKIFGNDVDFYLDGGELDTLASTLIKVDDEGRINVLREGEVKL